LAPVAGAVASGLVLHLALLALCRKGGFAGERHDAVLARDRCELPRRAGVADEGFAVGREPLRDTAFAIVNGVSVDPQSAGSPVAGWGALTVRSRAIVLYRLAFSALTLAAIGTQLVDQVDRGGNVLNFFSFFTILSNLIVTAVFIAGVFVELKGRRSPAWDLVRGAAASYMITTGIVYTLLLSGLEEDLQTVIPWVNGVVHYWMPLVAFADWAFDRPSQPIRFRKALVWFVYPLAWLAYTIARGAAIDWFPYPFLDPGHNDQGYAQVAVTTVVIFCAYAGLVWVISRTSRTGAREG